MRAGLANVHMKGVFFFFLHFSTIRYFLTIFEVKEGFLMRKSNKASMLALIEQNKQELLKDSEQLQQIEKRVDEKISTQKS